MIVSEGYNSASGHRLCHLVCLLGVLEGFLGMLVSGDVFLLPVFFTGAMGVGREVMQFGSSLVIFVMRSVVIPLGHKSEGRDLPGPSVGFLGELIGAVGIFKGPFRMPVTCLVIALFVVFGGGPVGVGR